MYYDRVEFSELLGKTLVDIKQVGDNVLFFETDGGQHYQMLHQQDCCEGVSIEEIHGDFEDLIGSPILLAEEVSSDEPDDSTKFRRAKEKAEAEAKGEYYYGEGECEQWTFYKLSTIKGSVTIRWYGTSNGYYSTDVSFEKMLHNTLRD